MPYFLTTSHPQGYVMAVKCEPDCKQTLNELIVQVWLLYQQQNFKYYTFLVNRMQLWTVDTDARFKHIRPGGIK